MTHDLGPIDQLPEYIAGINDILPDDWSFAGVLLRADASYVLEGTDVWWAIAAQMTNRPLGAVPEIRASAMSMTGAVFELLFELTKMRANGDI